MTDLRSALVPFVPAALLAAALLVLAPIAGWTAPSVADGALPFATITLLVTLAALHRPHGGALLGLGAFAIPLGFEMAAPVPTAIAASLGAVAAEALRRPLERRRGAPLPERRGWLRVFERAALAGLGVLAAGGLWLAAGEGAPLAGVGALAALLGILPAALHELAMRRAARGEEWRLALLALLPLGFDLGGWALGILGVAVWRDDLAVGAGVFAAFTLLALEAARHDLRAEATGRTLAEAEKLTKSGATLAEGGSELARLARRIFRECAVVGGRGAPSYLALELDTPESGSARFWAEADGEPIEGEPDPPSYPPPLPGFHRREAWRVVEHPLVASSERHAVLRIWWDPRKLEPTAESSLATLLPQMQAAVREALAVREATIDRLTGAATRRALERQMVESFASCRDEGRPLAVVMADLDHFKRINDTHGHSVGDQALLAVAGVLLAPMRGRDLCGRYGGEEFALLFEDVNGDTALEIAERLRKRVEAIELRAAPLTKAIAGEPRPGGNLSTEEPAAVRVPISMSFGVASSSALAVRSAQELLELADAALYTAKRLGRNVALLDCGGGSMRTGGGERIDIGEGSPFRPPVFFA